MANLLFAFQSINKTFKVLVLSKYMLKVWCSQKFESFGAILLLSNGFTFSGKDEYFLSRHS